MAREADDPRLDERYLREVSHPAGDVTLVGVVHDHPASVFRAGAVVESRHPSVVALELPPLAVPLFRSLASEGREPDAGGEMVSAIAAAPEARHVGIDALDAQFVRRLAGRARTEGASVGTVTALVREALSFSRTAIHSRFAALRSSTSRVQPSRHAKNQYGCEPTDPPVLQAERERDHVNRCETFARVVKTPPAIRLRDETREACMAERLASLRRAGDVVAVVGIAHLDSVAERLVNA